MKKLVGALIALGILLSLLGTPDRGGEGPSLPSDQRLAEAFAERASGLPVQGGGTVIAVLPDDRDGSPHQRFVLKLDSGQTLLVAHDIDVGEPVERLAEGDFITFSGEYEWNEQGGVVQRTHRDPVRRRGGGWLQRAGRIYR